MAIDQPATYSPCHLVNCANAKLKSGLKIYTPKARKRVTIESSVMSRDQTPGEPAEGEFESESVKPPKFYKDLN